jgi:hypothetical protein
VISLEKRNRDSVIGLERFGPEIVWMVFLLDNADYRDLSVS